MVKFEEGGARYWIDSGRPGEIAVFVAEYWFWIKQVDCWIFN
jgi:hypothetical protein